MVQLIDHGDVRQFRLSTWYSRRLGYGVSVYQLGDLLVDTGFHRVRDDVATILDQGSVRRVVLTHWHEDHSGNLPLLVSRGLPTWMASGTRQLVHQATRVPPYRWLIWGNLAAAALPPAADQPGLEVLPTPGHSEDHVVFIDRSTNTVFGGDLFLGVKACVVHAVENPYQLLASIRRVRDLAPARYFDAHRGLLKNPIDMLSAKADWLATAIGNIEAGLDRGDPETQLRDRVLGPDGSEALVTRGQLSKLNFVRAVATNRSATR